MKKNLIHILTISGILLIAYLVIYINQTYNSNIGNYDFWWGSSMQYGYSNIFKKYFIDFFNSFYLYDSELGYDHSYYAFSPLNPFYFLSFLGLGGFAIDLSNLFSIFFGAYFIYKITKILNLDWIYTYVLIIFPLTFISVYNYFLNTPFFNGSILLSLYILFFFDLKNRTVNYYFYIFFFILTSLISAFSIIFNLLLLFFILCFFYNYKKIHNRDLLFFFTSNLIIWTIVLSPYIVAKLNLSNIYFTEIIKFFIPFLVVFFLYKLNFLKNLKKIYTIKFRNVSLLKLTPFFIIILLFFFLFSNFFELDKFLDIFKSAKTHNIITFLKKHNQFDLIREVTVGSGIFAFIPIGLIIYSIITYQKNNQYLQICLVSLLALITFTLIINSQFFYAYVGSRYLRYHLNYLPIIIMLFIYLNLLKNLESNKKSYFFGYNNFNRNLLIIPALVFDTFVWKQDSAEFKEPYLFIFALYLPFLCLFFIKFRKIIFFIMVLSMVIQPYMTIKLTNFQYGVEKPIHNISHYKDFFNCYRVKSKYEKYDRVLATGVHETVRNYIPIMSMLTERERGTDINILYQYREVLHPELKKTYSQILDYKYYGKYRFPPSFYDTIKKEYRFEENFFDQLGINSVIVFNDQDKLFPLKYKSFRFMGSCENKLYQADIYKSTKTRGSSIFISEEKSITKLSHISKNSWDISSLKNSNKGSFILKFSEYLNTSIYIDNEKINFKNINGELHVPFKEGKVLKIIYQNNYHRLIFLLTILEYLIILIILIRYCIKTFKILSIKYKKQIKKLTRL